jgi:hypothetical protein
MQRTLLGIINMDFEATDQLLITYSIFVVVEKKWEYYDALHQLFLDFKKAYDSVKWEVVYNILIELGTP